MAVIETWFTQDLQMPVKVQYIDGNLFSHNGGGNRIGVIVTNNGSPVNLSGSVSGYAVLSDGTTVPCTGTRSGNQASILIPPAAYVPGSIMISIFLTDGSTVTTLLALSSSVIMTRTNTQVDPGSVVTDWTNTINAAMQAVTDASVANIGVPYESLSFPVPLGAYTIYNNLLYRCVSPIASAESWTAAHWTRVRLADDVSEIKKIVDWIAESPELVLHASDFSASYDSTYGNQGYITDTGAFSSNTGFRTYYYQVPTDEDIYITSDSTYVSLATFYDPLRQSNLIARYRKSDNNLPTENNRLSVSAGDWVAISIAYSASGSNDFSYYSGTQDTENLTPTDEFLQSITIKTENIEDDAVTEEKTNFFSPTVNILNPETNTRGKFIDGSYGYLTDSPSSEVSDYIPVKNGDVVYFTPQSNLYIATYNAGYTFISRPAIGNVFSHTITANGYVRFARYNSFLADDFMVSINTPIPGSFEEYGSYSFKYKDSGTAYAGKADKTETSLTVYIGKLKFFINKYNNSSIRAVNLWRTNTCDILNDNNEYIHLWYDSDSDGVVRVDGEQDFIGGYHGDETQTLFRLFVDGVEFTEGSSFQNLNFNELVLCSESNVYHCNTSASADTIAFKRNKIIKFNKDGYTVENYWTAQENITLAVAYMGMLSIQRYVGDNRLITGYHTNNNYKYTDPDTGTENANGITDVLFNTIYGDVGIRVSNIIPADKYKGSIVSYTGNSERLKAYMAPIPSVADGALNAGDVIRGSATTYFPH